MSAALHSIVRLMPPNSKVEQIESRTASCNGLCSTFVGPLYVNMYKVTNTEREDRHFDRLLAS
jgi:hypothetical protein